MTMTNTYKRLDNGTWGAWIETHDGKRAIAAPEVGDEVTIKTKGGEKHNRIVAAIIKTYKYGVVVALMDDDQIAAKAEARYAAKTTVRDDRPCPHCGTYCYGDCQAY